MIHYIKLIRPHQWIKNLFIFVPSYFAGNLFQEKNFTLLLAGFSAFSMVASAIYILNDYRDIESDRLHPKKKTRPLASGKVKPGIAFLIMCVFILSGLSLAYLINKPFLSLLSLYLILNIGYCFGLKNISLVDIFIVASGFLLRALSGGLVIEIHISQWLVIMVFLLALFLALAKRRDDILMYINSGKVMRKSIKSYNIDFTNSCLTMISGVIIVAYLMYTISPEVTSRMKSEHIYFTTVFVMAGIMRYLQITLVEENSGSPVKVLYSDKFIISTIIGWLLSFYIIIYLPDFLN
jgi:decaprenyl-phosphate phosphoribosyltransferase